MTKQIEWPPQAVALVETSSFKGRLALDYECNDFQRPPPEAQAAFDRIVAKLAEVSAEDMALVRLWQGNPVLYTMVTQTRKLSAEEDHRYVALAEADARQRYPDIAIATAWRYGGAAGPSGVRVVLDTPAPTEAS
ncbi:MAG TPA: hypothetical protein VGD46_19575 [Rhizobacter sp.]